MAPQAQPQAGFVTTPLPQLAPLLEALGTGAGVAEGVALGPIVITVFALGLVGAKLLTDEEPWQNLRDLQHVAEAVQELNVDFKTLLNVLGIWEKYALQPTDRAQQFWAKQALDTMIAQREAADALGDEAARNVQVRHPATKAAAIQAAKNALVPVQERIARHAERLRAHGAEIVAQRSRLVNLAARVGTIAQRLTRTEANVGGLEEDLGRERETRQLRDQRLRERIDHAVQELTRAFTHADVVIRHGLEEDLGRMRERLTARLRVLEPTVDRHDSLLDRLGPELALLTQTVTQTVLPTITEVERCLPQTRRMCEVAPDDLSQLLGLAAGVLTVPIALGVVRGLSEEFGSVGAGMLSAVGL